MHADSLQERAAARAEELPGAGLEHPFGPDWEVWKVRGKVFLLMAEVAGQPVVTVKAAPDDAAALCAQHHDVSPGWHMNKRHWITVRPGDDVQADLLDDLVTESYLLVVEGLPRARRPVDPATFAGGVG